MPPENAGPDRKEEAPIQTTTFGRGGPAVTLVGLGGEGVLRTTGRQREAAAVVAEALVQGVGYFDTAPAYAGSESYLGAVWKAAPEARNKVFHTSKSARRDRGGALADLEHTLSTLGTDYLDLWQIHDVRTPDDIRAISGPGGALEAFVQAREEGRVKRIGVTGHHDPAVLTRCVEEWPVDAVLLPVNPVEATLGGFLDKTLPAALSKGCAAIGMKVLGGGSYIPPSGDITADLLMRWALSQPVTCIIVGCSGPEEVRDLASVGRTFRPLPEEIQQALVEAFEPHARELAFYRGVR